MTDPWSGGVARRCRCCAQVLMGAERTSAVISEENKRLTAYHEGGHALVVRPAPRP